MSFNHFNRPLHGAIRCALYPEILAVLNSAIEVLVQAAKSFVASRLGLFRGGRAVDEAVEPLVIGSVTVIFNHVERFLQQENHTGWIREETGLFQR